MVCPPIVWGLVALTAPFCGLGVGVHAEVLQVVVPWMNLSEAMPLSAKANCALPLAPVEINCQPLGNDALMSRVSTPPTIFWTVTVTVSLPFRPHPPEQLSEVKT